MKSVYFDSAATTQVRDEVIKDMQDALAVNYGNPSSTHAFGRSSKAIIESARKTIAKYLNALPQEIIFTSGGTEADNMILRWCRKRWKCHYNYYITYRASCSFAHSRRITK